MDIPSDMADTSADQAAQPSLPQGADRIIWAGLGRQPKPRRDIPTIAIEFVSASKRERRRDYAEKRKEYLAAGVVEYWLFDRFERGLAKGLEWAKQNGATVA